MGCFEVLLGVDGYVWLSMVVVAPVAGLVLSGEGCWWSTTSESKRRPESVEVERGRS